MSYDSSKPSYFSGAGMVNIPDSWNFVKVFELPGVWQETTTNCYFFADETQCFHGHWTTGAEAAAQLADYIVQLG